MKVTTGEGAMNREVTILIAEDDDGHADLIRKNLARSGIANPILRFRDGQEVSDFLFMRGNGQRREPGNAYILLLDIRMPKMDGFETMGHILKSRLDSPIIIHSAYSGYKEHPLTMAAEAYIVKSHDFTTLKATISDVLEKRDMPHERQAATA